MSKECRNCGSKNTDIEGVFKNCYSCGLRVPVSWEDNDKPASESAPEQTSAYCGGSGFALGYEDCHCKGTGEERGQPASESVAALSEEDRKRIDQYLNETLPGYSLRTEREWVKRGIEAVTKYERAKQAELVAENERLKQELQDEKDYLRGIIKQTEQDAAREIDKYRP